jgi:hypothetical protein
MTDKNNEGKSETDWVWAMEIIIRNSKKNICLGKEGKGK